MTLAQTMNRRLSFPPALAGPLLFVASIAVALGVFSANLADLDGILFGVAVLPASLALVVIAEARQGSEIYRRRTGLIIAGLGIAVIAGARFRLGKRRGSSQDQNSGTS